MSALYCDKGMAFDLVADDILNIKTSEEGDEGEGILYLGDSKWQSRIQNDNPAERPERFERIELNNLVHYERYDRTKQLVA